MTNESENKTNNTKTNAKRSTWSGVLKNLDGQTIGYVYLYPTSAKREEDG